MIMSDKCDINSYNISHSVVTQLVVQHLIIVCTYDVYVKTWSKKFKSCELVTI